VSSQKVQQNTYDFEKSINDNIGSLESQPDPPNETNTSSRERGKTRSSRQVSPELVEPPKKVTLSRQFKEISSKASKITLIKCGHCGVALEEKDRYPSEESETGYGSRKCIETE